MNSVMALLRFPSHKKLWKLGFLVLFLGSALTLYLQWHQVIVQIIEWQKLFHALLAKHIAAVAQNAFLHGWALVALSFGYGVFHAIGPGHGKAVIVTYLGTHKESINKGVAISMAAAVLQALIAISLVSVLAKILGLKFSEVNSYGSDITTVSYLLVGLLGGYLLLTALYRLIKVSRSVPNSQRDSTTEHSHHHHSDSCCSNHHVHQPTRQESWIQTMGVVLSMGIRPCAGAIIVLIYAHLVDAYWYGIIASLVMGLGTGLSVSAIALGTQFARNWFESVISEKGQPSSNSMALFLLCIRILGGMLLVFLGWSLYSAAPSVGASHPLF